MSPIATLLSSIPNAERFSPMLPGTKAAAVSGKRADSFRVVDGSIVMNGLFWPAMHAAVRLMVADDALAPNLHPAVHWRLEDSGRRAIAGERADLRCGIDPGNHGTDGFRWRTAVWVGHGSGASLAG